MNSNVNLSRVLVHMQKLEPRELTFSHSRTQVRLDPSHASKWSLPCCCRHWYPPNNFENSSDAKNSRNLARIDCDRAGMVIVLNIAFTRLVRNEKDSQRSPQEPHLIWYLQHKATSHVNSLLSGLRSLYGYSTAALTQRPWVRIPLRSRNFFLVNLQLLQLGLLLRRSIFI